MAKKKVAKKKSSPKPKNVARPSASVDRVGDSVSVRQIENGFIVSRSGERKGKYFSKESYSKTNPVKGA